MRKRIAAAAWAAIAALAVSACVSNTPDRQIDYSEVGFSSDDGSR